MDDPSLIRSWPILIQEGSITAYIEGQGIGESGSANGDGYGAGDNYGFGGDGDYGIRAGHGWGDGDEMGDGSGDGMSTMNCSLRLMTMEVSKLLSTMNKETMRREKS